MDDNDVRVVRTSRDRGGIDDERARVSESQVADRPVGASSAELAAEGIKVEIPEALNLAKDRVRWGPIWAGIFSAVTTLLLLGLLGLAIGLTRTDTSVAAGGAAPPGAARNAALWGGLAAALAFLLGGYVAGGAAAVFDRGWGALNGALVFLVGFPFLLWLATTGLGAALGIVGDYASAFNIDPGRAANIAQGAPAAIPAVGRMGQAAAWSLLGGLLLTLGASALGGALGTRRALALDKTAGEVKG